MNSPNGDAHAGRPAGSWVQQVAPWVALMGLFGGAVKYTNDAEGRAVAMQARIEAVDARQQRDAEQNERRLQRMENQLERLNDKMDRIIQQGGRP